VLPMATIPVSNISAPDVDHQLLSAIIGTTTIAQRLTVRGLLPDAFDSLDFDTTDAEHLVRRSWSSRGMGVSRWVQRG
jgi:hypothetical protein